MKSPSREVKKGLLFWRKSRKRFICRAVLEDAYGDVVVVVAGDEIRIRETRRGGIVVILWLV